MNFLILGAGAVVKEYYLPAFRELGSLSSITVTDISSHLLEDLQKTYQTIRVKQVDFRTFVNSDLLHQDYNAVIVALPNWLHEKAVTLSLKYGLDVLCEKPLSLSASGCKQLHNLAIQYNHIISVGMVRRLIPAIKVFKSALQSRKIGKIYKAEVEFGGAYAWLSDSGSFFKKENGGVLADMGVHYLDLLEDWFGLLEPVSYWDDACGGIEANCKYKLTSQEKIDIELKLSRTHNLSNRVLVKGELGELSLDLNTFDRCFWQSYDQPQILAELLPNQNFQYGDWQPTFSSCFAEQLAEFMSVIETRSKPRVTALDAAHTIGLIEWAYAQQKTAYSSLNSPPTQRSNLTSSKICITGATGFIGEHLVEHLYNLGVQELVCPVRGYRTCQGIARFPVQMPRLNLLDFNEVKQCLSGSRFIFHLAYGASGSYASQVTIQGTRNVVEAAIETGAECVVILSTMYVFGHPDTDQLVDESWPYKPYGGEYGISKSKMEQWCLKRSNNSGKTRIVILNPSCVYGPRGKTYTRLPIEFARSGNFCWVDDGRGISNYVYISNLIDAIVLASNTQTAHGQRFLISDGYCSWKKFLSPLLGSYTDSIVSYSQAELLNQSSLAPSTPKDLIRHLVSDLELIDIVNRMPILGSLKRNIFRRSSELHRSMLRLQVDGSDSQDKIRKNSPEQSSLPPAWLANLFGNTTTKFSSAKAQQILGWQSSVSLEQGQSYTVDWLKLIGLC